MIDAATIGVIAAVFGLSIIGLMFLMLAICVKLWLEPTWKRWGGRK